MASKTSGGKGDRFTAVATIPPSRPASTYSAIWVEARRWASWVMGERCGVRMAFSNSCKGESVQGSASKESTATAAILPAATKSARASMLKMPPRAAFTSTTPSFMAANSSAPNMPSVLTVRGRCTVMKSAWASTGAMSS